MSAASKRASKSCSNCRHVKRRCDNQRPSCGQCVRAKQECRGYRDEWEKVFRDQTNHTITRSKKHAMKRDWNDQQYTLVLSQCNDNNKPELSYKFKDDPAQDLPETIAPGSMVAYQFFASYLNSYFPSQDSSSCPLDMSDTIISGIHMLPRKTPMLENASSALSFVFLGKLHQDKSLLRHGLTLYTQALGQMSRKLDRKAYSDDIIYTCVLFDQIETHHCPESLTDWFSHIDGLTAIMQSYRSKDIESPLMNAIYGPHHKLKVALSRSMHPSGSTLAWLREPGEGFLHNYVQILVDVTSVACAFGKINPSDRQACQLLLIEGLALQQRYEEYYTYILSIYGEPSTYGRDELKSRIPTTCDLFGPPYKFRSVGEALLYAWHWKSCSYFYPLLYQIKNLNLVEAPEYDHSPQDVASRIAAIYISKALRCLPYCAQEGMNTWAMSLGTFSVTQALRVFSYTRDWERFIWSHQVMQYCGNMGLDRATRIQREWWNYCYHRRVAYNILSLFNDSLLYVSSN
ncbi:hypothetical protein BDV26DRAFT_287114 [Aspergillus bertholletiae]|uniref:Zn(2)-C6 fungal-type domain-containing protein n=1 Tax=Aspergillus bertholletiae TaxID=1226010 RepID=A0A5N7APS9_9EURO|nr:hypothetical protein BDV26DRAFT_287114 [Aspergillus bertholletiae]